MTNNVLEYWIRARDATSAVLKAAAQKVEQFGNRVKQTFSGMAKESGAERLSESVIHTEQALDKLAMGLDRIGVEGEQFRDCLDVLERAMDNLNKGNIKAADLFDITKNSLADVGLTSKQTEQALNALKSCMVQDVSVAGKDVARGLRSDMRGVHTVVSALNGNVYALGRAFTWLLGHIKRLHLSAAMLSGIGIAVYALTEAVSKGVSWWREKKKKLEEIKALRFEETLKRYSEVQRDVSQAVSDYTTKLDREIERKRKLIEQNERLKSQELERLRIAELAAAKSNEERDAINRDYDALQAQNRAEAAVAKARLEIDTGNYAKGNIQFLIRPLEDSFKAMKAPLEKLRAEQKRMIDAQKAEIANWTKYESAGVYSTAWGSTTIGKTRDLTEQEKQDALDEWMVSDEEYKKVSERLEKMEEQYESTKKSIEDYKRRIQREADRVEDATREVENIEAEFDIDQWRDQEEAMYAYYEEMGRLEEEAARQAQKDAEAQARLERQLHEERMRAAEDEYRQSAKMQSDAESRLAAAQSKVAEAWGFYRNKNKMQDAINEFRAQQEAEKQWAKDFERLRSRRRDWRDVEFGQLSAEEEAVRQVALAKEEERAAQVALDAINEQTARAADAVEEIQKILTNGGEP